jgi:hypothetical protein
VFVGQTRFSLFMPGAGAWRASGNSIFRTESEYRAYLFSEERLDIRSRIFFNYSLPQLADAAEGYDVTHLISYSENLPRKYQRKLEEASIEYSFLELDKVKTGGKPVNPKDIVSRRAGGVQRLFAEYRLDDDDMLSVDYFERLAEYVRPEYVGMYVSFGAGIAAIYVEGRFYDARRSRFPLIAIGLAKVCQIDPDGTITSPKKISHTMSDTVAPVILDSRRIMYIWTRLESSDMAVKDSTVKSQAELREILRKRNSKYPFLEDMEEVRVQFPHVVSRVTADPELFPVNV